MLLPAPTEETPRRTNRYDLKVDDEHTLTHDQVMAARGYERRPGGGWQLALGDTSTVGRAAAHRGMRRGLGA